MGDRPLRPGFLQWTIVSIFLMALARLASLFFVEAVSPANEIVVALVNYLPPLLFGFMAGWGADRNRAAEIGLGSLLLVVALIPIVAFLGADSASWTGLFVGGIVSSVLAAGGAFLGATLQEKPFELEDAPPSGKLRVCYSCGASNAVEWTHCYACRKPMHQNVDEVVRPPFAPGFTLTATAMMGVLVFGLALLFAALMAAKTGPASEGELKAGMTVIAYLPYVLVGFLLGMNADGMRVPEIILAVPLNGLIVAMLQKFDAGSKIDWTALAANVGIGIFVTAAAAFIGMQLQRKAPLA